jgi:hypothetical protein
LGGGLTSFGFVAPGWRADVDGAGFGGGAGGSAGGGSYRTACDDPDRPADQPDGCSCSGACRGAALGTLRLFLAACGK